MCHFRSVYYAVEYIFVETFSIKSYIIMFLDESFIDENHKYLMMIMIIAIIIIVKS